jgi:hypothetical protein
MLRPRSISSWSRGLTINGIGGSGNNERLSRLCLLPIIFFTMVIILAIMIWPLSTKVGDDLSLSSNTLMTSTTANGFPAPPPPTTNLARKSSHHSFSKQTYTSTCTDTILDRLIFDVLIDQRHYHVRSLVEPHGHYYILLRPNIPTNPIECNNRLFVALLMDCMISLPFSSFLPS